MSYRSDIIDEIVETLESVADMKTVQANRTTPVDIETVEFPCSFVYSGNSIRVDRDSRSVIGYETWEWIVLIEVWGKDQDMEELLSYVHTALFANRYLGQKAVLSYITGVDMMVIDADRQMEAMLIQYTVIYRHIKGIP